MDVLIIGGNRFVGNLLAWRLLARGDRVLLFNRGSRPDGLGERVERVTADRGSGALDALLAGRRFDATVDFAAFKGADVQALLPRAAQLGHYVFISTGQVYLVRAERPALAKESDFAGALMPEPSDPTELAEWSYGMGKRACEEALQAGAQAGLHCTSFRIPMVNGERDYLRRIEGYLWRMLDGSPILLPGGDRLTRHVYGAEVARQLARVLGESAVHGKAYNLAQPEEVSLLDVLAILARELGAPLRTREVSYQAVSDAGLVATEVSPFSGRWMSNLDPARAQGELGFGHRPVREYLASIVASFLAHPPPDRPQGYRRRAEELSL